jgi:hypothetical protein
MFRELSQPLEIVVILCEAYASAEHFEIPLRLDRSCLMGFMTSSMATRSLALTEEKAWVADA